MSAAVAADGLLGVAEELVAELEQTVLDLVDRHGVDRLHVPLILASVAGLYVAHGAKPGRAPAACAQLVAALRFHAGQIDLHAYAVEVARHSPNVN